MFNYQSQNGTTVVCSKGEVYINNKKVETPEGMKFDGQTVINGKVFIGLHEYIQKENKFKITFRSIWEYITR